MKLGIGIDTGGTCTDAVAYDYSDHRVLAKGKTLTTREDLSVGIAKALDTLPQWEGDRIFHRLLAKEDEPFFELELVYHGEELLSAALNGNPVL